MGRRRDIASGVERLTSRGAGYGYQFWRARQARALPGGDGAPWPVSSRPPHDTVVAITSGTRDMASVMMNLVWIVWCNKESALPPNTAAGKQTHDEAGRVDPGAANGSGGVYRRQCSALAALFDSNPDARGASIGVPASGGTTRDVPMDGIDQTVRRRAPGARALPGEADSATWWRAEWRLDRE
jgi:hypothetical protein